MKPVLFAVLFVASAAATIAWTQPGAAAGNQSVIPAIPAINAIAAVLDDFHDAASKGDGKRYFSHFAPDAVFLGTDASERWTLPEFRAYALTRFEQGTSWTYHPRDRHVFIGAGGRTAWFDEVAVNATYGECRGTGVLVYLDGAWRIAQYNLTIPIPNEIALEVVGMIRGLE